MKIEVEVSEAELKDALAHHVRTAVADRIHAWGQQNLLKEAVAAKYRELVSELVEEELRKAPQIREQIQQALINKIRGQLTTAMNKKTP
jgi:hypothetical protein